MDKYLTKTFSVDQTPEQVFDAINNVRGWWSGNIQGNTDKLGQEFTYEVEDLHYSKFRITELVPGQKVSWLTLDSHLSFIEDSEEWTGTTVNFDITEEDGQTQVRFTHVGLAPEDECYDVCNTAWGQYINGSLRDLITSGDGRPNSFEGEEALEEARSNAS